MLNGDNSAVIQRIYSKFECAAHSDLCSCRGGG